MCPRLPTLALIWLGGCLWLPFAARATLDEDPFASFEDARVYIKEGFALREDTWGGALAFGETKTIPIQLFAKNDYWFIAATDVKGAKISVQVCDEEGSPVGGETWQRARGDGLAAGVRVKATRTGKYRLAVKIESSPVERTTWGAVYLYR